MRPWPLPFARGGPGASRMGWSVPGGGGRHGLRRRGDGGDSPAGVGRHGVAGGAGGRRVDPGAGAGGLVAERTTGRTDRRIVLGWGLGSGVILGALWIA